MTTNLHGVAARLRVTEDPVHRWEQALRTGQSRSALPPGGYFGTGVDSGVIALFDVDAVNAVGRAEDRNATRFDVPGADRPVRVHDIIPGADAVAFESGLGDGSYPTWVGRTTAGRVACFVVDLLLLAPRSSAS
ncbi:DUF4241 domain-containing protein [Couchioplanes azureus]|uniref:DUF4241 domain-containing protein n=1 Tax=Couchioplanes caeruleus TaxID=56438 RepID=UPI00166FB10B|nr:DUF4241 domain-containing protein [Couchioplanes caeruleus]GGQ84062.1 hypothetical protein GCM10010166_62880 [Couchioplanes caeruleus subsp. azureus]